MQVKDSKRLSYALMSPNDSELLFKLDQDPEVMRYINGGKMTTRTEIKEIYIPRLMSFTDPEKGWGLWKITLTESGSFIGWILVRPMFFFSDTPEPDNLEIGWRFMRAYWGKGYATESALSIKRVLIQNRSLKKISAIALKDNIASISIMRKLGLTYLKTDLHRDPLGDMEVVYYQLDISKLNAENC